MNTRTTMKTVARSDWRLATAISAILLSSALPHGAAAQSANAALRGKAPASGEVIGDEYRHRPHATHPSERGRQLRARWPAARHLPGQCRARHRAGRLPGRRLDRDAGLRGERRRRPPSARSWSAATRLAEVKTSEVGGGISLRQIEVTPQITRNFLEFADAVPGMQFSVDAKGNTQIRSGTLNTGTTNVYIDGVGQKNYVRPSGATGKPAPMPTQGPVRTRIPSAIRATRSRSSPSPNTRSSRRTTRPSTTRFRAPRSRP